MLTELLVLLACSTNQGCQPTTDLYFQHNPEMKQLIKHKTAKAKQLVGPKLVSTSPFILLIAKGRGTFKIGSRLSLHVSDTTKMLVLSYDF